MAPSFRALLLIFFGLCRVRAFVPPRGLSRAAVVSCPLRSASCRRAPRRGDVVAPAMAVAGATPWAVWAKLLAASSAGLWAERTRVGAALSAPIVTMGLSLALANIGALPPEPAALSNDLEDARRRAVPYG